MNRKLIMVADATRAYFAVGEGKKIHGITIEMDNHEIGSHEPDAKKNERTIESYNSYDHKTENKDAENLAFAKQLTDQLNQLMEEERYEGLIIVATPKMLGLIRKKLKPHWTVEDSLALEATHLSLKELEEKIFDNK